jgi:hypothetical protein
LDDEENVHSSDGSDSWIYPCQVDSAYADELKRKEQEKLKKNLAGDSEDIFDVEDIFDEKDIFDKPVKKKVKR